MAIKKNQADLPRSSGGHTPDAQARFVTQVARTWWQQYQDEGNTTRAMAKEGTTFRGSDAGSCSFALALTLLERAGLGEKSNPPGMADSWRMGIGTMVHDKLEEVLPHAFPGATCEVVGITVEGEASFHADVLIEIPDDPQLINESEGTQGFGKRVLLELKTINGFAFKNSIGAGPRPAEGPRENAILQGALAAEAFDCDELVIGYLSLELVSVREAQRHNLDEERRFSAEWTFTREEFLPLAQAERARMRWIEGLVKIGQMPERTIPALPAGAVITDPNSGAWQVIEGGVPVNVGTTWHCDYCWHRDSCRQLAQG